MHKAASDRVLLALRVPEAALALAAMPCCSTVCHSSAGEGWLCSFKVVTALDPTWEVSQLTAATIDPATAHKVKQLGGRCMSVKHK
jgi:hypothetical protein